MRADVSGLFECLPEAKSSVSTADVCSARSKVGQLISHLHSALEAEQKKLQNSLSQWRSSQPKVTTKCTHLLSVARMLRQETLVLCHLTIPLEKPRQVRFSLCSLKTCTKEVELGAGFDLMQLRQKPKVF